MKVKEVAARCQVDEHTVLTWIHNGDLRAINVAKVAAGERPRWFISEVDYESFLLGRSTFKPPARTRRSKPAEVVEFYQ
jgi:hypothetical protein